MAKTVDDLLSELEEEEKNAEAIFTEEITGSEEETSEEAEKQASKEEDEEVEKQASKEETEKEAMDEKTKKKAEEAKRKYEKAKKEYQKYKKMYEKEEGGKSKEKGGQEKEASLSELAEEDLVKIASDMGKVMAQSCAAQLVAMGVMPPTNADMAVPPVSQVSMPSDSPVTVAADAEYQMKGQGGGGKVVTEQEQRQGQEKKASHNIDKEQVLTNLYNQYFPKEEQ